jgi:hypothetical protein
MLDGDDLIGTARFLSREIAAALPTTSSVLLKFGLLYLFFWYLFDFGYDLGYQYLRFTILVAIAAFLALALLIWKLVNSCRKVGLHKDTVSDSFLPFVSLNLIPIAAVAVATWYGHYFGWGLLQFTQYALKRIAGVF